MVVLVKHWACAEQDCDSAGLPAVTPQLFASVQVRVWILFAQALHAVHCQLGVHVDEHDCDSAGLPVETPQLLESVHILVWTLFEHALHAEHCQPGVQVAATHCPLLQIRGVMQVPQLPPQPLSPHCLPVQLGVHMPPYSKAPMGIRTSESRSPIDPR
jgi:hypothetical protein